MFVVNFSGPAGTGINTVGLIVGNYFAKIGYNVYADKEYQSIIKGGNNNFINYISNEKTYLTSKIDLFFAFDEEAIKRNEKVYNIKKIIKVPQNPELFQNIVALAMFFKGYGFDKEQTTNVLKSFFKKEIPEHIWEKNLNSIKFGYEQEIDFEINLPKIKDSENSLIDGNHIVAESAVASGLEFYSAYPMTPASTLINYITKHKEVEFFQGEDEIAVAMSMLGANFAGKKAMCGTSGGGFALMTETISYANQSELGGIYVLSQRAGPSTGTPTFTEQADLLYALNASFGDTKPIVVYPSSFETAPQLINKVFYWSEKYQHPIIVLLDKQFSESYISGNFKKLLENLEKNENIDKIKFNPNNKEAFLEKESLENNKFLRYKITENGISAYTYPGVENGEFIASSYEHTESGSTTENPEIKKTMTEKRHKKMETFEKEEFNENFKGFIIKNENAKKFFITMGINTLTLEKYIENNPEYGILAIEVIQPLNQKLKEFILKNNIKELIFVELNYSGQLEETIVSKLNLNCENIKISNIRKYANYPLFIEDIK